jgi:acyl transferase domain-containing protein/SAM-dependent methyltransferase
VAEELSPVKRALLEVRELRARLQEAEAVRREPIAIVGMGLRFPGGAIDPDSFWDVLREGRDAITEVPPERWDVGAFFDPSYETPAPGKMYTRHGGFIEHVDLFDPHFFGISPREAASMDPQQRLMLEVVWEALEDAGQAPDRLLGSATGVFIGAAATDYARMVFGDPARIDVYASTGTALSVMAGRLSYILGLEGPCLTVDTACSASLVALHLACQALRNRECRMALAGGVSLMLSPDIHINFCQAKMLAVDGRCKTFDAGADGYVRGEGCGVVVLKRLSDALAGGDRILAVIRGSAVNQDGRSNGLTAPSGPAQEAVIRAALGSAGIRADDLDYVEAHGTGTSLGDPIELRALGDALRDGRPAERPVVVGSVKTNVGHLEAAAGVAGLIKVVLALQHETIPPHLHFQAKNPHVDWSVLPVRVPTAPEPWPRGLRPRLAGVSSFGFSGTNAHVVVEEAPLTPSIAEALERPRHLLALSAKSQAALLRSAKRLAAHLAAHPELPLADVAFTEGTGRAQLPERLALAAATSAEARAGLEEHVAGQRPPGVITGTAPEARTPELVFLFTGSGAQYVGMGRQLFETQPTFRHALQECDEILKGVLDRRLLSVLYPEAGTASPLDEIAYTPPALFALQYALAALWRSWGVEPAVVLGHSAGELVAACVAGVFSLEEGLRLSTERSRLMQALRPLGGMAAVFADEAQVAEAIAPHAGRLWIAAVNAADNVVISGEDGPLQAVLAAFEARGVKGKRLAISNAFHSPLVEPMLDALETAASRVTHRDPRVDLISNLTGTAVRPGELGPSYWRRHVRETVRFGASVRTLADQGYRVFLEIGPHPTLLGMAQDALGPAATCLPSLRRTAEDWPTILESLGTLFVRGVRVDFDGFDRGYARHKVALPTYPFQRQRHWLEKANVVPLSREVPAEAAVRAAAFQSRQGPLDLAVASFPAKWDALARLTTAYEIMAFRKLGAFTRAGETHSPEGLRERLGIAETYRHLLARWLGKLAADGLLEMEAGAYVARAPLPDPALADALQIAEAAFVDYPEMLRYVRRSGEHLAEILTGKESPLETLFPGGAFAEAEGLYQHSSVSRYLNGIVGAAVEAVARSRGGRLHVLEIGAGTGGTTAAVLRVLPPERTAYAFTDVSDLFLSQAARKFADFPFVRYGLLDMEKDPQEQGYPAHAFDVVVASNVLHATRDLRLTMDRALALLAPGGVLVLSETTSHPHHFDITTGLIEGWQTFADDLRGDNPLLSAPGWVDLLHERGFANAAFFPSPGAATEILGNHVILASAPAEGLSGRDGEGAGESAALSAGARATPDEGEAHRSALQAELQQALPAERQRLLAEFVRREVMRILRLDAQHTPSLAARLMDLGLDSLMAVQLRNHLVAGLSLLRPLSATLVFDHPTCEAIAVHLDRELGGGVPGKASAASAPERPPEGERAREVEQMTDEETEAQLLKRLQSIEERAR